MIPYLDLKAQHRAIRFELDTAIGEILDSAQFILGPAVENFEKKFADYCGVKHVIAVNSGTSALHMALLALGIGAGDEVITSAHTFIATVAAIRYTGAKPVLVDIDPKRMALDARTVADAITPRTKAIIPVHMHGQMADCAPLQALAKQHSIAIIEDAAQAHGATYHGKHAGSIGDMGCFSFYPGKNLGACGEGGAITTSDDGLAQKLRALRDWGQLERGVHALPGYNYRMEGLQGAVLGVKLPHLTHWTNERRRVAATYDRLFAKAGVKEVISPSACTDGEHVYHHYVIRIPNRDNLREQLTQQGIHTAIHYALPIHLQPVFADMGYKQGDFPHAEQLALETLSLPIYPELTDAMAEKVVQAIITCLR